MKKTILILISLFLSFSTAAEELPVEYFVKHGDYLDIKMSPDGEHFAARIREKGRVVLIFIRAKDWKAISGLNPGDENELFDVTWVNNERVVFSLAEKQGYHDRASSYGELYGLNVDGTKKELLYGYRSSDKKLGSRINTKVDTFGNQEILNVLPKDKKHILILEHPWQRIGNRYYPRQNRPPIVSKLNVYTGKKRKIEIIPFPGAQAYANDNGDINFVRWWDKDDITKGAYRESHKHPWQDISDTFSFSSDLKPVGVNQKGTKAYVISSVGEKAIETLFEIKLATGEHRQLFNHADIDIDSWTLDHVTKEPIIAFTYPDKVAYHYITDDNDLVKYHKMLVKAFKGNEVVIADHTDDGKKLLVHVSSDLNPGEYYIFNTDTKKANWLWVNRTWIDPREMSTMTPIELTARDGVPLKGYLTLPKVKEPKELPLVVLPHGGPHEIRDSWEFNDEVQLFANRGYAVLQINFRGSGGYGEVFEHSGYNQWGEK